MGEPAMTELPVFVIVYRQCGHQIMATADLDAANAMAKAMPSVEVREATDADLAALMVHRRPCVCRINDAKALKAWQAAITR
jgi:hypothetical protein